jgi:hypothetical protein
MESTPLQSDIRDRVLNLVLIAATLFFPQLTFAGSPTIFDVPGSTSTWVIDMNNHGQITGYYYPRTGSQNVRGYVRGADGSMLTFAPSPEVMVTVPAAINNLGVVTGTYWVQGIGVGFIRGADGTMTAFRVNDSTETAPVGINDSGVIAGWYTDSKGNGHGFVRDPSGSVTTFEAPGCINTDPTGINASGEIVGDCGYGAPSFLRDSLGNFTTFEEPRAGGAGTTASAINSAGAVTGYYVDHYDYSHPYVRDAAGNFTSFDAPRGYWLSIPSGINDAGQIVGLATLDLENNVGWVRDLDGTVTTFNVQNCGGTNPERINKAGIIAGDCVDGGTYHGFVTH